MDSLLSLPERALNALIFPKSFRKRRSPISEYAEVLLVMTGITVAGGFHPASYRALGHVYLLAIIILCLRVGRWPVLLAALLSVFAWNYVVMPPRFSLQILSVEDQLMLGTHLIVALIAGHCIIQLRSKHLQEIQREERATALFNLTRAFASSKTLDEALERGLQQADTLFQAKTALCTPDGNERLILHHASSHNPDATEMDVYGWVYSRQSEAGLTTSHFPTAKGLSVPLQASGRCHGVFTVVPIETELSHLSKPLRELIDAFATQFALQVEREQWRVASEREHLLAESNRLHRTLLDSVSHELKTPLAVLRAASEKLPGAAEEKRDLLTAEICTATSRLDHLVANLLNQSRLESGTVTPKFDWCDLRDIVAASRRSLGERLAARPFRQEFDPELPLAWVDAPLLEQAVTNLFLNSLVHTPPGTAILVRARALPDEQHLLLQIADRGPGLPAELRPHLFQKFKRGKSAGAGGAGLGLSIVHGFVRAQGGNIVASNAPEGGAVFSIYLPLKAQTIELPE